MLLSRYGDINFILAIDYEDGIELINKAEEKILEDKLYIRWIPFQEIESFSDFKNRLLSSVKKESKEEILDKVNNILAMKVGE